MKKSILFIAVVAIVSGLSLWQKSTLIEPADRSQIPSVNVHSPANPGDLPVTYQIEREANQQTSPATSREIRFVELETPSMAAHRAEFIGAERIRHHVKTAESRRRYYLEDGAEKSLMQWPR